MPSSLESKALWTVTDEGPQEFSQTSNKLKAGDNLIIMQEARMPLSMSDGQEFKSHERRNVQSAYTRRAVKMKDQSASARLDKR